MVALTAEELREIRLAMAARVRATSPSSSHGKVCEVVLKKLTEAERRYNPPSDLSGPHNKGAEVNRG